MNLSSLKISDLRYRSEGNASICFTIKDSDFVLKLSKTPVRLSKVIQTDNPVHDDDEGLTQQSHYHEYVMRKHFDDEYLCGEFRVIGPFEEQFIVDLMSSIEENRPIERRIKTVDSRRCSGLLVRNWGLDSIVADRDFCGSCRLLAALCLMSSLVSWVSRHRIPSSLRWKTLAGCLTVLDLSWALR